MGSSMSQSTRFSIDDIVPGSSNEGEPSSAEPGSASRRPPLEDNFDEIITDTVSSLVNGATKNRTDELMEWIEEKRHERMARAAESRRLAPRVPEKLKEKVTNTSKTVITKYEDSSDDECTIVETVKRSFAPKPVAGPVIAPMVEISPQALELLKAQGKGAELSSVFRNGGKINLLDLQKMGIKMVVPKNARVGGKLPPITLSTLGSAVQDPKTTIDPNTVKNTNSARKRITTEQSPTTGEGQGTSVAGQETPSGQVSAPIEQREIAKVAMDKENESPETQYKKWKEPLLRAIGSGCIRLDDLEDYRAIAIPKGVGDIYGDIWFKKFSIAPMDEDINLSGTEPFCIQAHPQTGLIRPNNFPVKKLAINKEIAGPGEIIWKGHDGERIYRSKAIKRMRTSIDYDRATGIDIKTLPSAEPMSKTIVVPD